MKELFGKEIWNIWINEDKDILVFSDFTRSGCSADMYMAEGGCCSKSWFESINNAEALIGETIIGLEYKVSDKEINYDSSGNGSRGVIKVYGYTLKTKKGYIDIEFRNDSNGYYTGSCEYKKVTIISRNENEIIVDLGEVYFDKHRQYTLKKYI